MLNNVVRRNELYKNFAMISDSTTICKLVAMICEALKFPIIRLDYKVAQHQFEK